LKILVVARVFPIPPNNGAKLRVYSLLRKLSEHHDITIVARVLGDVANNKLDLYDRFYNTAVLEAIPRPKSHMERFKRILPYVLSAYPPEIGTVCFRKLGTKITEILSAEQYDVIQLEHSSLAYYLNFIPKNCQARRILTMHNIESIRYHRMFRATTGIGNKLYRYLNWKRMRRFEPDVLQKFDKVVVVSQKDAEVLSSWGLSSSISIVENGVDTKGLKPLRVNPDCHGIIYVGSMDYFANEDAVVHFCRDILPKVRRIDEQAVFYAVGRSPSQKVKALARDDVVVTGEVDNLVPYYEKSAICVVPLRVGGGTRLKILEAMALGVPVVSTTVGCEGLDVQDGVSIAIRDDPNDFADAVISLLEDKSLRDKLVCNARRLVVDHYDWGYLAKKLEDTYR
jgi:polysaccharide biosynthesis protein PslH